jgi:DNA-binding XRE family transcriptional regulator
MRKQYTSILKQFFYEQLIHTREERRLTQAQMARLLEMDERSYVDLDHGKSGCSSLTLVRFLIYCYDDPKTFLEQLRFAFEQEADHVA